MAAVPPETQTANYGWIKPYPTGSTSTWGATLNADLDAIDAQVKTNANAIATLTSDLGVTDGTDAAAGKIGEFKSALISTSVNLLNGIQTNIGTVSLTAGDWDVFGWFRTAGDAATTTVVVAATLSLISATFPSISSGLLPIAVWVPQSVGLGFSFSVPSGRVSTGAGTTLYLVGQATWSGGAGVTGQGYIGARRAR